jgi:hypothetical protein
MSGAADYWHSTPANLAAARVQPAKRMQRKVDAT